MTRRILNRRTLAALVATVVLAVGVGACGDDDSSGDGGGGGTGALGEPEVMAAGLKVPWGVAFLPDGDALVSERNSGRILRIDADGGSDAEAQEEMSLEGVRVEGEGGLLGLAVSPTYDQDGFVYAYYATDDDDRVVRFKLGEESEVVLDGIESARRHHGGRLAFGPDGMLYVTTGDSGTGKLSQDPDSLNGKILRINPDGSVPEDNPDPDSPVYTLGHRNVEGLAWDSEGQLWASEFGEEDWDELNLIEPGNNYGWPDVEGEGDTDDGRLTNPVLTWKTSDASPSGLAFLDGSLYMASLRGKRLWQIPVSGGGEAGEPQALLNDEYGRLRTAIAAPDGSLWLTTSNTDGRGDPKDDDDQVLRFPAG